MPEGSGEEEADKEGSKDATTAAASLKNLKIQDKDDNDDDSGLFKPPPPRGDCPVCMIVLPLSPSGSSYSACCGNSICCGCMMEHQRVIKATNAQNALRNRDLGIAPLKPTCPFCRVPLTGGDEEIIARIRKRMELNDPVPFYQMADHCEDGECGMQKDERKGFELYLRSTELGSVVAFYRLALCYLLGKGVEKDEAKARMFFEKGAKGGVAVARHNLGCYEHKDGNFDLAVKHWTISAGTGFQPSLDEIKVEYQKGHVSKEDFERALRAFHAARKEEWSKEREAWAKRKARK